MTTPRPIVIHAAAEFLKDDARRRQRPRLTPREKGELSLELAALQGRSPLSLSAGRAVRGDLATRLLGYDADYSEVAVNVIADIMHAVAAHGGDPLRVIAHARAEFFEDQRLEGKTGEFDAAQDDH